MHFTVIYFAVACTTVATREPRSEFVQNPVGELTAQAQPGELTAQAPMPASGSSETQPLSAVRVHTWAELDHPPEQVGWYGERLFWIEQNAVRMCRGPNSDCEQLWSGTDPHGLDHHGKRLTWLSDDGVQTFDLAASKTVFIGPTWRHARAVAIDVTGRVVATLEPAGIWHQRVNGQLTLLQAMDINTVPHRLELAHGYVWYRSHDDLLLRLDQQARTRVETHLSVHDAWWVVAEPARLFVLRKQSGDLEIAAHGTPLEWSRVAKLSDEALLSRCGAEVCWYEPEAGRLFQSNGNLPSLSTLAALGSDVTLHPSDDSRKVVITRPAEHGRTRIAVVEL